MIDIDTKVLLLRLEFPFHVLITLLRLCPQYTSTVSDIHSVFAIGLKVYEVKMIVIA